ncbi:MAG: glycosyltransferase family 2 protein [Bacteroidales bacterium]|jgi:glycosyltransferase involved in cell wall biosynthesis|nr:glycosyltransferase family 2 protein [Bacteroidales bacterium]
MYALNNLTIIVPAYNEAPALKEFLPRLLNYCAERNCYLILINDGSTDESKTLLDQFTQTEKIVFLHHKLNRGYGAAIKSGLAACNTELVITIDADGQHALEDIDKLYALMESCDADLVVGSRQHSGYNSYYRGVGKFIIRNLARILMTVPVQDLNSGMKLYRTELAKQYIHLAPDTMSFSDIFTLIFINNRNLVVEEPIHVQKRKTGKSTIGIETAFQTVMEIINIVILFSPMKIFLPLSLLCLIATATWAIPLIYMGRGLSIASLLGIILGILLFLLGLIAEQLSQIRRNQHKSI